jgi:hypothetical protein
MTNDSKELQERLEQATARQCPAEDPLDPETAALRAGWSALVELLEAAQPQADPPLRQLSLPPAEHRKRWLPVMLAVLAASVLVAAAVTWIVQGTQPGTGRMPQATQIAGNDPQPRFSAAKQIPASPQQTPTASNNSKNNSENSNTATWDDSLDQQITAVSQAMVSVRDDWYAQTGSASAIEYQLQQIKNDMDDGRL